MWWRNKHVGHRVDQDLEQVVARIVWGALGAADPTARMSVRTRVRPEEEGFETCFAELSEILAARIWDTLLFPLQQRLFEELGAAGLARLKSAARPGVEPATSVGEITVAMDIGSRPT